MSYKSIRLTRLRRYHTTYIRRLDFQSDDVVSGDLAATLEAHRASNLARRIRKYDAHPERLRTFAAGDESKERRRVAQKLHIAQQPVVLPHRSIKIEQDAEATEPPEDDREDQSSLSKREVERRRRRDKEAVNAALAYGSYVRPLTYGAQYRFAPYLRDNLEQSIDGQQKLNRLIREFEHYICLNGDEVHARKRLLSAVIKQLRNAVRDVEFQAVGSLTTGLATPLSDIDGGFDIVNKPLQITSTLRAKAEKVKKLRYMHRYSYRMKSLEGQKTIRWARVPVLTMRHAPSGIDIQIASSLNSVAKTTIIRNWMDEFPLLRPIYMVVKTTLDVRGLTDPSTGGLGSYTLVCMIVTFFRLAGNSKRDDVGTVLWEFLDFYGHFNTRTNGISVEPTTVFKKRGSHQMMQSAEMKDVSSEDELLVSQQRLAIVNDQQPWLLCIQDPDDFDSDLGKSTTRIMDIRMTFRVLSQRLRSWLAGTKDRQTEDPLMPFFGKMLGHVRDRRRYFMRWVRSPSTRRIVPSSLRDYELTLDGDSAAAREAMTAPSVDNIDENELGEDI